MKKQTLPVLPAIVAGGTFTEREYDMGLNCSKKLFLDKHRKELAKQDSGNNFQEVVNFKNVAKDIITPLGIEINTTDLVAAANRTRQILLRKNVVIIYNAVFINQAGEVAIADVIVKDSMGIRFFEFRATTQLNDTHVFNAAYKHHCATTAGYQVGQVNLVYINKDYVRDGDLTKEFLRIKDVTEVTNRMKRNVPLSIATHKKTLKLKQEPFKEIGMHCLNPHECVFKDYCWEFLPTNNIFDVKSMKITSKFGLYYKGIETMEDLKEQHSNKLKDNQIIQINAALTNSIVSQPSKIADWLNKLRGKELFFWDVETIMPIVPPFDGVKSMEQIITTYSVHIRRTDGTLEHREFMGMPSPEYDFRRSLLLNLFADLEASTSNAPIILVYNKTFEATRLRDLQKQFPQFKNEISNLLKRIVDLMDVFKNRWYVDPRFKGSYSIKSVLPVLCPDLDYKKLEITNGMQAMQAFMKMYDVSDKKQFQIRAKILEYCKMDTYAMVRILEFLEQSF